MPRYSITKYVIATSLEGIGYEVRTDPYPTVEQVLALAGENDNDTILQIDKDVMQPIYKWSQDRSAWQMVQ